MYSVEAKVEVTKENVMRLAKEGKRVVLSNLPLLLKPQGSSIPLHEYILATTDPKALDIDTKYLELSDANGNNALHIFSKNIDEGKVDNNRLKAILSKPYTSLAKPNKHNISSLDNLISNKKEVLRYFIKFMTPELARHSSKELKSWGFGSLIEFIIFKVGEWKDEHATRLLIDLPLEIKHLKIKNKPVQNYIAEIASAKFSHIERLLTNCDPTVKDSLGRNIFHVIAYGSSNIDKKRLLKLFSKLDSKFVSSALDNERRTAMNILAQRNDEVTAFAHVIVNVEYKTSIEDNIMRVAKVYDGLAIPSPVGNGYSSLDIKADSLIEADRIRKELLNIKDKSIIVK